MVEQMMGLQAGWQKKIKKNPDEAGQDTMVD